VDVLESHNGADTMPGCTILLELCQSSAVRVVAQTVLNEDVEALFYEKCGIEDNKSEADWQDIVTGTCFEECAYNMLLRGCRSVVYRKVQL